MMSIGVLVAGTPARWGWHDLKQNQQIYHDKNHVTNTYKEEIHD